MPLGRALIGKIMHENRDVFEALANYDRTREWPIGRARIDITLDKRVIKRLKEMSIKSGKPVSRIIEECVIRLGQKHKAC
jgi:hypothetical protein